MNPLAYHQRAKAALEAARSVGEVIDIRNAAEGARAYARMAKDRELEVNAIEIRITAERRLGQILIAAKDQNQIHRGGRPAKTTQHLGLGVTLPELGITRKLSSRAQQLARTTDSDFRSLIASWRLQALSEQKLVPAEVRVKQKAAPFSFGGDIRNWSVALLRRRAAALNRLLDHCGAAADSSAVTDCISDKGIAAILEDAFR